MRTSQGEICLDGVNSAGEKKSRREAGLFCAAWLAGAGLRLAAVPASGELRFKCE
jgi:hypothetical protein